LAETFTLHVNGATRRIEAEPDMPLLYALRAFAAAPVRGG
jgi:aerobic-type carbon monoxide dehydrogenase small subunit (CoxS/CutS family)